RGLSAGNLSAEQLQEWLFPTLDRAYAGLLDEDSRRGMLRSLSEQLVAQELGAVFAPTALSTAAPDSAATDTAVTGTAATGPVQTAPAMPAQEADEGVADEDWDFGEDEFELEDPEYLNAPVTRAYDLGQSADQSRLIADLGRVSGVQSVMICRENGEVMQMRSLKDLSALGSVVAATVLLLRGRSLRLMSAQVGGTVVCVRPLGSYAVAVLASPEVNSERGPAAGRAEPGSGRERRLNHRPRAFSGAAAALLGAVLFTWPAAQAQDLGTYRQLTAELGRAQSVRPSDVGAALTELDRAEASFAALRPTLRDPQLSQSVQGTLDRARAALARTPADLQAQTIYAQALLRQALFTQTLQDLLEGRSGAAEEGSDTPARLKQLAQDFGLETAETAALSQSAQAGQLGAVAARLQRAAARQIVRELKPWQTEGNTPPPTQDEAYLRLTRASGWHLHLAELAGTPAPASYTAALTQLARGDLTGAAQPVRQLSAAAELTAQQLTQVLNTQAPAQATRATPPVAPSPAATNVIAVPQKPATDQAPQAAAASGGSLVTVTSQPQQAPGEVGQGAAGPVYAALARALAAAANQDRAAGHAALQQALAALNALPDTWQGPAAADLARHLQALSRSPAIAPGDIAAEITELQALEQQVQENQLALTIAQLRHVTSNFWSAKVQAAAFLLLTLLLPLPFYFKFRALGHQKGEWPLIVTGIGMLVVPAFGEGLIIMLTWLGTVLDSLLLQNAGLLSVRHSPLGHFLWWLFTLIGVLLMTAGFYQLSRRRAQVASAKARWASARTHGTGLSGPSAAPPTPETPGSKLTGWARLHQPPEQDQTE
ncbi:MAG: hypothetical protein Q4C67_08135, partial [Deinococcus sp.]|nr:hypothetical protein [Deinococcus sp.]